MVKTVNIDKRQPGNQATSKRGENYEKSTICHQGEARRDYP